MLASDRYADAVRADEAQARAYGISGVPFFVVDGKYGISGAQPADAGAPGARDRLGRALAAHAGGVRAPAGPAARATPAPSEPVRPGDRPPTG